jgi:beta-lactamase class A
MILNWILVSIFTLAFLATDVTLAQLSSVETKAQFLCNSVFKKGDLKYVENFSAQFIKAVPEISFNALRTEIIEAIGECQQSQAVTAGATAGKFEFKSSQKRSVIVNFAVDRDQKISGFLIKEVLFPDVILNDWSQIEKHLQSLSGKISFSVKNSTGARGVGYNDLLPQPIGSGFKLYVLGALAARIQSGQLTWEQPLSIRSDWKSLPSGIMQDWAVGTSSPLKTFADYMIRYSDNTATDHLIQFLGRDKVSESLKLMGNRSLDLNSPFLTTLEFFKLKWAAPVALTEKYKTATLIERTKILNQEVASISSSQVGQNGVSMASPSNIHSIEWFGSTEDLCRAMFHLKDQKAPEVLDTLSKNTPFIESNSVWSYRGYKGGSEAGVLSMTYLLKKTSSDWICVSMAWSHESQTINQWVAFDLIKKVLQFSETNL